MADFEDRVCDRLDKLIDNTDIEDMDEEHPLSRAHWRREFAGKIVLLDIEGCISDGLGLTSRERIQNAVRWTDLLLEALEKKEDK